MKNRYLLAGLFLAFQIVAFGQDRPAYPLIAENPDRAACNMHSYEFKPIADTKAPEGFIPVYVSHYGRHGSRHDISSSTVDQAVQILSKADSLGQLTEAGRELLSKVGAIAEEHVGMGGELTPRGGREHQQLAARMVWRFPEVFVPGRDVKAVASTVQRCIVSMGNFTASLKGQVPGLVLELTSGERYSPVIRPGEGGNSSNAGSRGNGNQGRGAGNNGSGQRSGGGPGRNSEPLKGDYSAFLSKVFVNKNAPGIDHNVLLRSVYKAGCMCQDLDFLGLDIFRTYFTTDELYSLWEQENSSLYGRWGNSVESGGTYGQKALPLLEDIINKADAAMSDVNRAADLRFGHDMGYMALCCLLGIDSREGGSYRTSEASSHWFSFDIVPMAANIQFIFYRNASGKVLVKVLRNEEEVLIPGLSPVEGPYYDWSVFKNKFVDLL